MSENNSDSVVINTMNLPLGEAGIEDGDINPEIELTHLNTDNPSIWFELSHRVCSGWKISLSREELEWILAKMDENKSSCEE